MDIMIVVEQMFQLFIMIGIGYGLGKTKLLNCDFQNQLTKFVLNLTMPCMIVTSVLSSQMTSLALSDILISTCILVIILPIFAYICTYHFHKNKSLYMFMMMYPNVGFMGFPLMQAIFGNESILNTAIINMAFNISLFTLGVFVMSNKSERSQFHFKNLLSPGVVASFIAIVIYLLKLNISSIILEPLTLIGNMTTPLAMIIIGASLTIYPLKSIFNDYKVYIYTLFIDLIIPILFYPMISYFISDIMIQGITLIILAMPVANGAVLFAKAYQQDEFLAAKTVFISTLLGVMTIPLIVYLHLI
ncbi:AEC family transporter [Candidatus Stoquefichus massiliensis]|uniref:AEC family transporter n=1 Tax=Candidatus Stoquefichus massiliensis TaxID=1470350 RepID=UPI00047FE6E0|nr:AEC family transporter [Candidatus Stoquefichus massiliensis]